MSNDKQETEEQAGNEGPVDELVMPVKHLQNIRAIKLVNKEICYKHHDYLLLYRFSVEIELIEKLILSYDGKLEI